MPRVVVSEVVLAAMPASVIVILDSDDDTGAGVEVGVA